MTQITLGVISDTHIPLEIEAIPDEVLAELAQTDAIVHAGDFVSASVLQILQELGPPVYGVVGNLDGYDLRSVLPETRVERIGETAVGIVHGWGPATRLGQRVRNRFKEVDLVIYGHSHTPLVEEWNGAVVANPGSVACNRDGTQTYALIHLGTDIRGTDIRGTDIRGNGIRVEHKTLAPRTLP